MCWCCDWVIELVGAKAQSCICGLVVKVVEMISLVGFTGPMNHETFSTPLLWCDPKDDCIILIKRICLWSCELEYFTHWFVATVRATSGFQSPDQSAPGSTSVSLGPAFSVIHDLSYIFRPAVQQNWLVVDFSDFLVDGTTVVVRVSGLNADGLSLNWPDRPKPPDKKPRNTGAPVSEVWPRFALKLVSYAMDQSDSVDILVLTLVGSPQTDSWNFGSHPAAAWGHIWSVTMVCPWAS